MTTSSALEVRDLRVRFRGSEPVSGVSFELQPGERTGLVGESGSGKTLTALSIMRLVRGASVSGQILLDGQNLLDLSEKQMESVRGGRVAMVYQDPLSSLNPVHTIGDQLVEAIRLHDDVDRKSALKRAIDLLDEVGVPGPERRVGQYQHEFSGGMRQRVMIAMAMSARPAVLIADEPTTALDVTTQARIIDLLDALASGHDTAVLLITHDLGVAAGFCDSIHVMQHGLIVESGDVDRIYRAPSHPYTRDLLDSVVDLAIDVNQPIPSAAQMSATASPPTRSEANTAPQRSASLLKVTDVNKLYDAGSSHVVAAKRVSFEIPRGQTFGLVGESGSGKSTMARAVLALTPIDSGVIELDGQDIHRLGRRQLRRLRARAQIVFQDPYSQLNRSKSVAELVAAPLKAHDVGSRRDRSVIVEETLERVGLNADFLHRYPASLSGGQCQRVAIARALVLNPELLILDESVSALDVSIQAHVLNLLRVLQRQLGLTYLFITHDLAVVRYMAQHIAVMKNGEIVEQGSRDQLFESPQHPYTRELLAAVPVADPEVERQRRSERFAPLSVPLETGLVDS